MTFTAVNLSRLPAPDVVEQIHYEQILAEMLADLRTRDPSLDMLVESDPVYKLLEVCAYREMVLRQQFNDRAKAVMLAYAMGADLDNLGALLGVTRLLLTPADPIAGTADVWEADEAFRRRITLAPESFSVAGPEGAYIYHALGAHPGVLDASATSPVPGEVVVTILGNDEDGKPQQDLLDAVEAALSAEDVRPLTDKVIVQSAIIVPYEIRATLYTYVGPDSTVVIAEAMRRLHVYISDSHRLGCDVPLSGLYAALHGEGVQRVELHSPTADVVCDRTQAPYCSLLEVIHGGQDE